MGMLPRLGASRASIKKYFFARLELPPPLPALTDGDDFENPVNQAIEEEQCFRRSFPSRSLLS